MACDPGVCPADQAVHALDVRRLPVWRSLQLCPRRARAEVAAATQRRFRQGKGWLWWPTPRGLRWWHGLRRRAWPWQGEQQQGGSEGATVLPCRLCLAASQPSSPSAALLLRDGAVHAHSRPAAAAQAHSQAVAFSAFCSSAQHPAHCGLACQTTPPCRLQVVKAQLHGCSPLATPSQ